MDQHGFWTVTEDGYFYPAEQLERENDWALIRNQLGILVTEGTVERREDGFLLPHKNAVQLEEELQALLELPDFFPFEISIQSKGSLGSPSFHYEISYIRPDGRPFFGVRTRGSYVELDDYQDGTYYMFNEDQYTLIQLMETGNKESQKITNLVERNSFNTLQLAKVKSVAERIHATVDRFMERQKIVTADKLSVRLEKNLDGSYSVYPVMLKKSGKSYTLIPSASLDSVFLRNTNVHNILGSDRTKYVFTQEQAEGLRQIRQCQHLSEQQAQKLSKCPNEVFDSEAFTFEAGIFGDRVVSIGKFEASYLPYSFSSGRDWLPPEGSSPVWEPQEEGQSTTDRQQLPVDTFQETEAGPDGGSNENVGDELEKAEKSPAGAGAAGTEETIKKSDASLLIKENFDEGMYHVSNLPPKEEWRKEDIQFYLGQGLQEEITPFSYQMDGMKQIAACWKYGYHGVLLADDMGLGKTMQAFGFLAALKKGMQGQEMDSVLIVAPVSLLQNWEAEYAKFLAPDLYDGIVALYGSQLKQYRARNADGSLAVYRFKDKELKDAAKIGFNQYGLKKNKIILTTYETLRDLQISFGEVSWSVMIIDEAQKIKNPGTRVSEAVRAMNYNFGLALTGTPVENSWNDLWTIMDFVQPHKLKSLKEFNKQYQKPLEKVKNNPIKVTELGNKLRKELDPCFIRRLKDEVQLPLPQKNILKFKDFMPDLQKKMYGEVVRAARGKNGTAESMLKVIGQLRDISLCPNLGIYNEKAYNSIEPEHFFATSARLLRVKKILDDIHHKQEKVILFVESRKLQLLLETFLEKMYGVYVPAPINGTTEASERQRIVDRFNGEEGFQILLLSPLAAGVGLNITGANHVIHLSRCWNPAKEDQATDRAYRIGQKKDVTVYIPMAYDPDFPENASFDLTLDALLDYKRELGKSALYPTDISSGNALSMFHQITGAGDEDKEQAIQWTIEDTDKITGAIFEVIISKLYQNMGQYKVIKTRDSGDKGADVIAQSKDGKVPNLLIQCKQTSVDKSCDGKGVQEVQASLSYYKKLYQCDFQCVVITNATHFTHTATTLALANGVKLIGRGELARMLDEYPIERTITMA